jgi:hypothetical protein
MDFSSEQYKNIASARQPKHDPAQAPSSVASLHPQQ